MVQEDVTAVRDKTSDTPHLKSSGVTSEGQPTRDDLKLYPRNWLYNAGVVGWLSCFDMEGYFRQKPKNKFYEMSEDGSLRIDRSIFREINVSSNYLNNEKVINLKGKNKYYRNFIDTRGKQVSVFEKFVNAFSDANLLFTNSICEFCDAGIYVNYIELHKNDTMSREIVEKFYNKISQLNMSHNSLLGPSISEFPNSAWNFERCIKICHLCTFLIIHHHKAFTQLSDNTEIFINAPSFELMYELNKLVKKLYGSKEESKDIRKILGITLIEYSRRLWFNLGKWSQMNIEVVIRRREAIDFYSLPYYMSVLLSDREIASLISSIGESEILDYILNGEYDKILENVYSEMRKYFSNKAKGKKEKLETFKLEKKLKLYSAIKERIYG